MSRALRVLLVVSLAVVALVPGVGAAQAVTVPATLSSVRAAEVGPVSPGFPIDAVGVTWDDRPGHAGDGHADEFGAVRFRTDGAWGPWHAFGEDGAQAAGSFGTTLVAGHDADAYQVRGVPAHAEVVAVNTTDGPAREVRVRRAGAADASAGCWSRYDWGADESKLPTTTRSFAPVQVLTVHHTGESAHASGDPAAWVRSMYAYHLSRGWDDIGYSYLVGPGGELFEGRRSDVDSEACQSDHDRDGVLGDGTDFAHDAAGRLVTGAHTGGYNTGNAGISVLGDYRTATPTAASRGALVDVLADLAGRHGLPVANDESGKIDYDNGTNAKRVFSISMHKDLVNTLCPGGSLEADMPALRNDVAATVAGSSPPATEPEPVVAPAPARSVAAGMVLSTFGGKQGTNHVAADVTVADVATDPDTGVAGVAVTVRITNGARFTATSMATTAADGRVQVTWKNLKGGTYTVTVTDVADPDWNGQRPSGTVTK